MTQESAPVIKKYCVLPKLGEAITSLSTKNTYTIGQKIGEGAFSVVFECWDIWENNLAAKVLKPVGSYEKVRKKAEAELQKLLSLRHPNITFIYDAFEYQHTFYIITEGCDQSLHYLLRQDWFKGDPWLRALANNLLQAVHYLHLNDTVHQDIHPGNVFLTFIKDEVLPDKHSASKFKLADFGISKDVNELSQTNTFAQWMIAPEIYNPTEFGPIDHRVDIYHVGLLLLQIALSKPLEFTKEQILAGYPRQLAEQLQNPLGQIIAKALRRHASRRPLSALKFWEELKVS